MAKTDQYVLITTEHRGVFAGVLKDYDRDKRIAVLTKARNCVSWSSSIRGFLGLAATGPDSNCKIGPAVDELELVAVTSKTNCTEAARDKWESAPWS